MSGRCLLIALPLIAGACSASSESSEATTEATAVATADAAEASASASPGGAVALSEKNELYVYAYAYPEAAGKIPELAALLDARGAKAKAELIASARDGQDAAGQSGFPYNAYSFGQKWTVVASTPGYLSLSSVITGYEGGAHGSYASQALVWDRANKAALQPRDMFTSLDALENALGEKYCAALDRQRAKKRGEPVEQGSDDPFNQCPHFSDLTILLGSSNGRKFNRIGLIADPYLAGPWAEGKYEVTLPVTAETIDAVKPEYAGAFAIGK